VNSCLRAKTLCGETIAELKSPPLKRLPSGKQNGETSFPHVETSLHQLGVWERTIEETEQNVVNGFKEMLRRPAKLNQCQDPTGGCELNQLTDLTKCSELGGQQSTRFRTDKLGPLKNCETPSGNRPLPTLQMGWVVSIQLYVLAMFLSIANHVASFQMGCSECFVQTKLEAPRGCKRSMFLF
jgi:hypothetical protein